MRPVISKRKSTDRDALLGRQDQRDMDLDACRTNTQRRKVSEEVLESDFASSGTGRVTGKGWWTGVEAGESGHWDLSLAIPVSSLDGHIMRKLTILSQTLSPSAVSGSSKSNTRFESLLAARFLLIYPST